MKNCINFYQFLHLFYIYDINQYNNRFILSYVHNYQKISYFNLIIFYQYALESLKLLIFNHFNISFLKNF